MDTGVARKPIVDMREYRHQLRSRRDPIAGVLTRIFERLRRQPKRVVFAEGEEEQVIRAASSFVRQGLGTALLVGREERANKPRKRLASISPRASKSSTRVYRGETRLTQRIFTSACSAVAFCSAIASGWSTRIATILPPAWSRLETPTPW